MTKFLSVSMLSLMLLQVFVLTVAVRANEPVCLIQDTLSTLPPTDITGTTAVFHGRETMVYRISGMTLSQPIKYPWIFKYGTQSGKYTKQVRAHLASSRQEFDQGKSLLSLIWDDAASVTGLTPCTKYYVLYTWEPTAMASAMTNGTPCPTPIYRNSREITFTTEGCSVFLGQGGSASGTGASSSSAVPVSAPAQMANILVESASLAASKVSPGQSVDVAASVANKGTASGAAKIILYVNGQEMESQGVTVGSGQTAPVNFRVSMNEPGTYIVHVGSVSAGSFTVDTFANNDVIIYGIIVLFVLGIAGTLYFILRRRAV